jgi:hypothetical protein
MHASNRNRSSRVTAGAQLALDWIEHCNRVAGAVLAIAALAHYASDDRVGEPQWVDERGG